MSSVSVCVCVCVCGVCGVCSCVCVFLCVCMSVCVVKEECWEGLAMLGVACLAGIAHINSILKRGRGAAITNGCETKHSSPQALQDHTPLHTCMHG